MSVIKPVIIAAIPLIPQTTDLFNRILAQDIFSPELMEEAVSLSQKFSFSFRTKNSPYKDMTSGTLIDIMARPNNDDPQNGLTIVSIPTREGFDASRLYIGGNVVGFIFLHGRTCCQSTSINATLGFKGKDGKIQIQHRASAEGHGNRHGYQFMNKCLLLGADALVPVLGLWQGIKQGQSPTLDLKAIDRFALKI